MTNLDIRDIESGQVYFAIADKSRGGRCVLNGMFIAVWLDKKSAKEFASSNPNFTIVKCLKP